MKVCEVTERILEYSCGGERISPTVDRLMAGDAGAEVTGVVCTFMATAEVIRKAAALGANLIISHETIWYTHEAEEDWLTGDDVYAAKKQLIAELGMNIWHYHDHMHASIFMPGGSGDQIFDGLAHELGWADYRQPGEGEPFLYQIPPTTLGGLARFLKERLAVKQVQIIGDENLPCKRIGMLIGGCSQNGIGREEMPMETMQKLDLDCAVCGEIAEWTLAAYANDAKQLGVPRGIIIIGHERSEESGMKYMPTWLRPLLPGLPVEWLDAEEPFVYI